MPARGPTDRRDLYDGSDPVLPTARSEERQLLIDLLQVEPHHVIVDVPAWTGYLSDGLLPLVTDPAQLICAEPSARFAAGINPAFVTHVGLAPLPLADDSVDRVGSMVGLHHLPRPDQLAFLREILRVLRPGGRLALSEVGASTQVASFLNGPVHRATMHGHRGTFFSPGACTDLLAEAGFVHSTEALRQLHWHFPSTQAMATFCRSLFGMAKVHAGQVLATLVEHFVLELDEAGAHLPWSLVYAVGVKPVAQV